MEVAQRRGIYLIKARRVLLGQKKIYGNAANKSLAKSLRSNVIVEEITFAVFSVPDTCQVITKKISGAQYTKNMRSMVASIMGSLAGTYGAGISTDAVGEKIGKKVNKKVNKKVGSVIGFVAGAGGRILAGVTVNKITELLKEDDCIITARLFNASIVNMSIDYYMPEEEVNRLIKLLDKDNKEIGKFQMKIRNSEYQYYEIIKFLEPYFEEAINDRKHISEKDEESAFAIDEIYRFASAEV